MAANPSDSESTDPRTDGTGESSNDTATLNEPVERRADTPYAIVLEDDGALGEALGKVVSTLGYQVGIAGTIAAARDLVQAREPTIMLIDVNLPDGDGLEFMAEIRETIAPSFVVITGDSSQQVAVKCIRARAFDMLPKPVRVADIKRAMERAVEAREAEQHELEQAGIHGEDRIDSSTIQLGSSSASEGLRSMIRQAAAMPRCLAIIDGESGTEKLAVAEAIHVRSKRLGRLITVNCAAEQDDEAHDRFFGREDNATGEAVQPGYLENAAAGTLVLDDITELSRELQARLLSFIDNGQFMRTGGAQPVRARVAVIGIARASIKDALASGSLREDFYYRLAQFPVRVPGLQARDSDKLAIAEHLLQIINERTGTAATLGEQACQAILSYSWPGNVRELKNALHRACVESEDPASLQIRGLEHGSDTGTRDRQIDEFVGKTFWQIEKELLFATLDHHGGDKEKTAKMLGISLKTLYNRLHAYS